MSSHLIPGDEAFRDDKQLMADLVALNEQLSRYIIRYLDADARRAEPVTTTEEHALANAMTALGGKVHIRATRRATSAPAPTLEGDATLRRLTNARPSER